MSQNTVEYKRHIFGDSDTLAETITLNSSLVYDDLVDDEAEVEVLSDHLGPRRLLTSELDVYCTNSGEQYIIDVGDIREFNVGDVAKFNIGDIKYKFYIKKVERLSFGANQSARQFRLTYSSVVGILDKRRHYGGIYQGETAGSIIRDIFGDLNVVIDEDVEQVPVYNYLPIASARENLQQVLFILGAILTQDVDGTPRVMFLSEMEPIIITDDRICMDESTVFDTKATKVSVTEHNYYISPMDREVSLFDNTDGSGAAASKVIEFSRPCHNLTADGLTIVESGPNYAIVTGTGTLTGYEYTHTMRATELDTGERGPEKVISVKDATLVSAFNSANVASRIADYYRVSEYDIMKIVMEDDDIRPGALLQYNDPDGVPTSGIVSDATIVASETNLVEVRVIKGYVPSNFGNNYENVDILTEDGSWAVPEGVDRIRLVLIGGGQAGYAGGNGRRAMDGGYGSGGNAGAGGSGGSVYIVDIDDPTGAFAISIGVGGASSGAYGTPTEAVNGTQTYTSATGAPLITGYRELLNNVIYATRGDAGIRGEDGGVGGTSGDVRGDRGEDLYYDDQEWRGGVGGDGVDNDLGYGCGGGGGGAAYGIRGGNGGDGYLSGSRNFGGRGGNGANAVNFDIVAGYGCGGNGGNGGGGAGGGGYWLNTYTGGDQDGYARSGSGGSGSSGNAGGNGIAMIYY